MNQEEVHDLAARYTQAWCSADADATAALFAENGSIAVNGGEPAVGRVEIAQLVQGSYDVFPDTVVTKDAVRGPRTRLSICGPTRGQTPAPEARARGCASTAGRLGRSRTRA